MTAGKPNVSIVRVRPLDVLCTRLTIENHAELAEAVAALREQHGEVLAGPPIGRILGRALEGGYDAEIALPVVEGTTLDGLAPNTLPADHMFRVVHVGPYAKTETLGGISETVNEAATFLTEKSLLIGDNPSRYVYLEGPETHGDQIEKYITEIQISYHCPVWLEEFAKGTAQAIGDEATREVVAGHEALIDTFDAGKIRTWVLGAVDRLDEAVPDAQQRACILQNCAHHYPRVQLERMRAVYDELGDLRALIDRLAKDDDLFPTKIWLDESGERPLVYIERSVPPWNREAYAATDDPVEKRYHACFCSMVKQAILDGEPISPSFCNCSGGWYVQMWEAILDRRLRIDVVESVLQGHDRCLFAVHVPEELL